MRKHVADGESCIELLLANKTPIGNRCTMREVARDTVIRIVARRSLHVMQVNDLYRTLLLRYHGFDKDPTIVRGLGMVRVLTCWGDFDLKATVDLNRFDIDEAAEEIAVKAMQRAHRHVRALMERKRNPLKIEEPLGLAKTLAIEAMEMLKCQRRLTRRRKINALIKERQLMLEQRQQRVRD